MDRPNPPAPGNEAETQLYALIACTVLHAESHFGKFFEMGLLRWIGRLSYSLYVWQALFLPDGARPLGMIQSFPLALILPFVCAAAS